MPRRPASLDSVVAALRQYFHLGQPELAQWLGMSIAAVGHLETGRRALGPAAAEALAPLVALLPPPGGPAARALRLASAAPPALAMAPPNVAPLLARLDYCQHHARRLRRALAPLEAQAATAARWAAALPALRAALPPDPGPTAPDPAADWPAWQVWHRHRWLTQRPTALPPDLSARYHLLRLQAEALEAEVAALIELTAG